MTDEAVAPITSQDISAACSVPVITELKDRTIGVRFGVGFYTPESATDRSAMIAALAKTIARNFESATYDGMTEPLVKSNMVTVRYVHKIAG